MVIDSSALIAILLEEPDWLEFREAILAGAPRLISAATWVEAGLVATNRVARCGHDQLDALIDAHKIEVVPVGIDHAWLARGALLRFGKSRHRSALNFGDSFTYALAKATGEPILCKGNDFALTDAAVVDLTPYRQPLR